MIRPATHEDVPTIVEMSRQFYATTDYAKWAGFCPKTVAALASNLAENHVMLIAVIDDVAVGMVGLFVAPFMFNGAKTGAYEVVWWVSPDAQGAGVGKELLEAIVPACAEKGAHAIQMVHLRNSPPHAAMIYEKNGYMHTESSYTRVL